MSGTATGAVQAAVFTRINVGSVTTQATVYDEPTEGLAFDYVLIGEAVELADNRMGGKVGKDIRFMLHAWTDKRGFKSLQAIARAVDALLDNYELTVTGYVVNILNAESVQMLREGILRHAILTYRINLVEA